MFVDYVLIDQERCLLTMASLTRKDVVRVIQSSIMKSRAYFNRLLRALFEKWNAYFSTKKSQNTYPIGGSGVLNAINLKKWEIKIKKCALLQGLIALFYYTPPHTHTHSFIFQNKPWNHFDEWYSLFFRKTGCIRLLSF